MKKINTIAQGQSSRSIKMYVGMFTALAVFVSVGLTSQALAYTQLSSTLDFGAKGSNVTNLQAFFADNSSIYPEGLVTGYFGSLTRQAVMRFQETYGIVSSGTAASTGYGRVGPTTLAKINSIMATGWTTADISGPAFFNVTKSLSSNSATISFNTNESATARVVYNTTPLMFNEGDINSNGFAAIGGFAVNGTAGLSTSHSITVSGLQSNTTYYYTVIATDAAGNVSVVGPNNTLHTN